MRYSRLQKIIYEEKCKNKEKNSDCFYSNCNNSNSSINFTISKEEMKFNVNDVIKVKFEENYLFTFE